MKKLLLSIMLLASPLCAMQRLTGWCEQGAKVVVAPTTPGGVPISRSFQQSYPICTVTVYITGTTTKASVFSTNNPSPTPLPNPFQASNLGYWNFYAANGHYDVQISGGGLPSPFTFGDLELFDIIDYTPCNGCILSATGFISTGGQYNDYSSQTGGALLRAYNVLQTADGKSGGYIKMSPLTYNPNDGPPVFDIYGNPVRDPVYLPGDSLGTHDAVLFVAEATDLIPNPDLIFGIFTNQYMFSRVGFATDYASEASFQSLNGGMQALSFAAVNYVNSGQHAGTPPPLTNLDQFHPGAIFYDTVAGCEKVYNGTIWSCLGSSGGGGSPGGPTNAVQFNNASVFGGSGNMTWDGGLQLFNVNAIDGAHAGINVHNGFIQADAGFVASLGSTYNSIQSAVGGLSGVSVTVSRYVQTGNSSSPPSPTTGDSFHAGTLYYDTTNSCEAVFDGSGWSCLSGGGSTSPGPPNTSVQFNSLGTFAGTNKLTWDVGQFLNVIAPSAGTAGVNVQIGFIQSATGFVAVPGSATTYNAVSALGGGMAANSFTAASYIQSGNHSGTPSVTGGDSFHAGALYWDTSANSEKVFNGTAWVNIGGGASAAGLSTYVQYNTGGAFDASTDFTWNDTTKLLNVNALNSASAGLNVHTGFAQADVGFVTPGTTFNAINAVSGGAAVRSITAARYVQTGNSTANPGTGGNPLTTGDSLNPGTMYWNTSSGQELVWNGTAWTSLGGGGTPGGADTAVQFNSAGTFGGNAPYFSWDNTGHALNVNGTIAGTDITGNSFTTRGTLGVGVIQSGATGTNIAFQTTSFSFQVAGNGNVSSSGQFNITGLGSAYKAGTYGTVIDVSGNVSANGLAAIGTSSGTGPVLSFATGTNNAFLTVGATFVVQGNGSIFTTGGSQGITGSTCSAFKNGLCVAP